MASGAPRAAGTEDRDILWRQYELHVGLYKHYLDLAIKLNIFFYAVTGGLFSFYFAHANDGAIRWSLALPAAMSFAFAWLFFRAALLMGVVRTEVFQIRDDLGLSTAPEFQVLVYLLRIFGVLFLIVGLAAITLVTWGK
jgi:hypothetical protein